MIKINEIKDDFSNIEIKPYLPFPIKKIMIKTILDAVVSENGNGIKVVDYYLLELVKEMVIVNNYTNLDLSEENVTDSYDLLKEKGIIEYICEQLPSREYFLFDDIISSEIEQIKNVDNSFANIVGKMLNKLIEKLPNEKEMTKILKSIPKELNKISPENLSSLSNILAIVNQK